MSVNKLCPFRKNTIYMSGRNSGQGYPCEWEAHEEFCDCVKDKCMMWRAINESLVEAGGYCVMGK